MKKALSNIWLFLVIVISFIPISIIFLCILLVILFGCLSGNLFEKLGKEGKLWPANVNLEGMFEEVTRHIVELIEG